MYKIWNRQENLILSDGIERTPEQIYQLKGWGWTKYADTVLIKKQGGITVAIENLDILRESFNISEDLSPEQATDKINELIDLQRQAAANPAPTAEERIAAMLEYQVLSEM